MAPPTLPAQSNSGVLVGPLAHLDAAEGTPRARLFASLRAQALIVLVVSNAANAMKLVYHKVVAQAVGPDGYTIFSSLNAYFTTIIALAGIPALIVLLKEWDGERTANPNSTASRAWKVLLWMLATAGLLVALPFLQTWGIWAVPLAALMVLVGCASPILRARILSHQKYNYAHALAFCEIGLALALFSSLRAHVPQLAFLAVLATTAMGACWMAGCLRWSASLRVQCRLGAVSFRHALPVVLTLGTITLLLEGDLLTLTSPGENNGAYHGVGNLARMFFYASACLPPIVLVELRRKPENRRILQGCSLLILLIGACGVWILTRDVRWTSHVFYSGSFHGPTFRACLLPVFLSRIALALLAIELYGALARNEIRIIYICALLAASYFGSLLVFQPAPGERAWMALSFSVATLTAAFVARRLKSYGPALPR